jgi:hypothetical protein
MTPVIFERRRGTCARVAIAIVFAQAFWAAPAVAQGLPSAQGADPLREICSSMLEQSGGVAGSQDVLCKCLVRETSAKLTRAEMVAYSTATQKGQSPPPAVMNKIMGIATTCLAQAQ